MKENKIKQFFIIISFINFTNFILGNSESKSINIEKESKSINIEKKDEASRDDSLDENKEKSISNVSNEDTVIKMKFPMNIQ
jgi:hypothetical protein